MADVAVLQAQLELQTAAFTAGVKQVDRRLKSMDQNFKKTSRSVAGMEKGLSKLKGGLAGIAASMAAAFSVQSVKNAIAFGDQMAKTAETVGLSVESFQKFTYAAERAGISSGQFASNMTAFVKRVGEAQANTGPLVSGLKKVDGALLESIKSAKNQEEALGIVFDAMNNAATATDRARIANAAFSRSGVAMGRMAENYKELGIEAENLGIVTDTAARKAEILQDKISQSATAFKNKFTTAVVEATFSLGQFFGMIDDSVLGSKDRLAFLEAELERQEAALRKFRDQGGILTLEMFDRVKQLRAEIAELKPTVEQEIKLDSLKEISVTAEKLELDFKAIESGMKAVSKSAKEIDYGFDELDGFIEGLKSQADAVKRAVDPMYVYESELTKLDTLLRNNLITWEQYADAVMNAEETYHNATNTMSTETPKIVSLGENMLTSFTESFDSFANGVAQGTTKVKDVFRQMVQALIAQFLKLMAYKGIMALLGGPSSSLGGAFGQQTGLLKNAKGNIFAGGNVVPFAKGGVTNVPTMFAMNNGKTGVMGEAGPEAIMPLKRGPGGELGVNAVQPVVNINNNAPVNVAATSRGDGTVDIEIVQRAVESAIRRGGNGISSAIESTYGVNRGAGAFGY